MSKLPKKVGDREKKVLTLIKEIDSDPDLSGFYCASKYRDIEERYSHKSSKSCDGFNGKWNFFLLGLIFF